jgi:hypothetical protein
MLSQGSFASSQLKIRYRNPLFRKILRISPMNARICPDSARYPRIKIHGISDLQSREKKIVVIPLAIVSAQTPRAQLFIITVSITTN